MHVCASVCVCLCHKLIEHVKSITHVYMYTLINSLYMYAYAHKLIERVRRMSTIWLFSGDIWLFCGDVFLFCGDMWRFCVNERVRSMTPKLSRTCARTRNKRHTGNTCKHACTHTCRHTPACFSQDPTLH